LKVGVVASDRQEWHVQQLMKELKVRGLEAYVFPATRFFSRISMGPRVSVRGYGIDDYDAVVVRKVPGGTAEQVFYRMDVLHRLEDLGVYVINPADAIERAVDKYYTSTLLEDAGIRTPRTVVTENFDEATNAFEDLGGDVVVKPLFGSRGMGSARISDPDTATRVFKILAQFHQVCYVQEYMPHRGRDIRAFVVGDEAVASMYRVAEGWKTNVSQGAVPVQLSLGRELEGLAVGAADALGCEIAGADIMETSGGPVLLEINSQPGWKGLQRTTELDIASEIVDFVIQSVT